MALDLDSAFGIDAQALAIRERRATVLAQNLANADTPGYKARDLDFRAALAEATGAETPPALLTTRPDHIAGRPISRGQELLYRVPTQPSLDGNTVQTDVENAAFLENAVRYQASLVLLEGRIRNLRTALSAG